MKNYKENLNDENKNLLDERNAAVIRFNQKLDKKITLTKAITILFIALGTFLELYRFAGWKFLGFGWDPLFINHSTGTVKWHLVIGMTYMCLVAMIAVISVPYIRIIEHIIDRYMDHHFEESEY